MFDQYNKSDTVVIWDLENDTEKNTFEVDKNHQIIWDYKGIPYLVMEDKTIFTEELCAIKAFECNDSINLINSSPNIHISDVRGHRMDGKNHNWILFREYLCLSFSYLTFVMMDKIKKDCPE